MMIKFKMLILIILWVSLPQLYAGTTGKISGRILDAENGDPLAGANIFLEGTSLGAAANLDGYYVILNIPPGNYTMKASMIGYSSYTMTGVRVNIDLTSTVNFSMQSSVVSIGGEVTVVAERPVVQKDISASQANIEAEQINALPVQRVQEVVGLQAGIIGSLDEGISIRGGDQDETAFMIDGFTLRDERNNTPYTSISLSSIQDIQVQTGGFNAEYGNIRSGIINVVTKEGDRSRYSLTVTTRYSPAHAKHFGPSGFDPDGYWSRPFLDPEVAWTGTENGAWDENTRRQYPSFSGWNTISQQTLQDNDPNNDLTPEAAQRLWKWQHRQQGDINNPDYTVDLGFGGPVPFVSRKLGGLRFFFSHRREQDAYLTKLSRDNYNDQVYQLKLTANIRPTMKLTLSGLFGQINTISRSQIGQPVYFRSPSSVSQELSSRSFIDAIMWVPDYFAPTRIRRYNVAGKITQTLSSSSFYEVNLERQANFYHTFPRRLRDTETIIKTFGDNLGVDEAPFGFMPLPSSGIAGMRMGVGMSQSRDSTRIYTTSGRFDFTSQVNENNQIKTGFEFTVNNQKARFAGVDISLPAGRPRASWDKKPVRAGLYLQDKLEFKGLIANLGMRVDYSNAGGKWWDLPLYDRDFFSSNFVQGTDSLFTQKPTDKQLYLSPRLGISHPITDNSKLFFNYGHFYSMAEAQRLYNVQRTNDKSVQRLGNPNLKMSRTKAYEIGFEQNLFDQFLLRLAGYYKDITNQPNWVRVISSDSKVNYFRAEDNFYEDIRGIEVTIEKKRGRVFTGFLNYTYLVESQGFFDRLRVFENPADQRAFDRLPNEQNKPSPRPFFRGNLLIKTPYDFGPSLLGSNFFGNWKISFLANWRAGQHTTWSRGLNANDPDIKNNVQLPALFRIDLRLSKNFSVGKQNLKFFIDVDNLFNNKIFSFASAFSDGNDFRDYMNSLLWPEKIGKPLGYTVFGNDKVGDLRPSNVTYDPLELNPNNDSEIEARNKKRRKTKSYIDNPNLRWLYYLNPRDVFFGLTYEF